MGPTAALEDDVHERDRRLLDALASLARSLREERQDLADRLRSMERELNLLAEKLEARQPRLCI